MKKMLLLLALLIGLPQAGQFFGPAGRTVGCPVDSSTAQFNLNGYPVQSFYASGPASGTWGATVRVWEKRRDGSRRKIVTFTMSQATPNIDSTGSVHRVGDALDIMSYPGAYYQAEIIAVSGTVPTTDGKGIQVEVTP
jgi:hypothetical protein